MKMLWLCKLGWHNWKYYRYLWDFYPEDRTCRDCGKYQTLCGDTFKDDIKREKNGGYY